MAVLSKAKGFSWEVLHEILLGNSKKRLLNVSVLGVVAFLVSKNIRQGRLDKQLLKDIPASLQEKSSQKGKVDKEFFRKLCALVRIAVPSVYSPEFLELCLLTVFLLLRTYLSIYLATVKGRIVKGIVQLDLKLFLKGLLNMVLCAFPGSFINSCLQYFQSTLGIRFRQRVTSYFLDRYLKDLTYYQLTNLDQRIANPDQRLTSDIHKWAVQLSSLYSNISKPILDIFLYSHKLSSLIGMQGPVYIIGWYLFTGVVLRQVSPVFGKLIAMEQKLEGAYRSKHSDIVNHSEEIAFYRGEQWEKQGTKQAFDNLLHQSSSIMEKRLYMGIFDSVLVKYGAILVGYGIIGIPVFGKNKDQYLTATEKDAAQLTRDYVRNSSLLIDLAGAIGRLLVSYKTLQLLAGYNTLVYEMIEVFDDLDQGRFQRMKVKDKSSQGQDITVLGGHNESIMRVENKIMFKNVPVISPAGETLIQSLDFEILQGMNCVVIGPNGCGKSSCFRILAQLWPQNRGELVRPSMRDMFYIPQRPYLPKGCLRDQIIYPHQKSECCASDKQLEDILQEVDMLQVLEGRTLNSQAEWNEVLSGGEKQRLAMARLFYHKPQFAILDECTSSTSLDAEILLYNKCKDYKITLFTISHRSSLFRFHDYMLIFDGEGGWCFEQIDHGQGDGSQLFQAAMQKRISQAMQSRLHRRVGG